MDDKESQFSLIYNNINDAIFSIAVESGDTFRFASVNRRFLQVTGLKERDVLGKRVDEVIPEPARTKVLEYYRRAIAARQAVQWDEVSEYPAGTKTGEVIVSPVFDAAGNCTQLIGIVHDITEHKQAAELLRKSELKYRELVENANSIILHWNRDGVVTFINEYGLKFFGYSAEELVGRSVMGTIVPYQDNSGVALSDMIEKICADPAAFEHNINENMRRDGSRVWIAWTNKILPDAQGKAAEILSIGSDVSDRKLAEQKLQHYNRALRAISTCNEILIHATDEHTLLNDMCRVIVEDAGYRLAWVGYAENDAQKTLRPMAHAGSDLGLLERTQISWADNEHGRLPTGAAIRTRQPALVRDTHSDAAYLPWRERSIELEYRSILSLPLISFDQVLGALTIYSPETDGFSAEEIELLDRLSDDLAFGIATLRTRRLHEESAAQLLKSLEGSIAAMAATVEMRDPYTAGHQRRVAELSRAIAQMTGLTEDEVHGIYLAGIIHDLGKIKVPAEILVKPSRLSEFEFEIIRSHPQTSYDILKEIDFPWPIAQMAYQHHERIDGSGYPNKLKDGEIIFGAKILSVADTVEAMSSHRPYRPGRGIDAALAEIDRMRGVHYDSGVVDACIKLFRERGYHLPA